MRINGCWAKYPDGVVRPILLVEVLAAGDVWLEAALMIDTGADRTVFDAPLLTDLNLPTGAAGELLGVGGAVSSVKVKTKIRMKRDDGGYYTIQAAFDAFTELSALDMSVLGRNVLGLFSVIVDHRRQVVCLLAEGHQYVIQPT
jgi:hypothetical protein